MEFAYLTLTELRKLLDGKKVSSVELTKYFLDRIKKFDKGLNSFITVCEKEALSRQKKRMSLSRRRAKIAFLCGIPYAAKDMYLTKGIRTTATSKILDNYIPPYDSTVIFKFKE